MTPEEQKQEMDQVSLNVYPVISLKQPWAYWVIMGWKTIETRVHNRLQALNGEKTYIHASLSADEEAIALAAEYLDASLIGRDHNELAKGAIIGSVDVYAARALTKENSKAALIDCENTLRYGLFLNNNKSINVIPVKGDLGIWYYDFDKKQKVNKETWIKSKKLRASLQLS